MKIDFLENQQQHTHLFAKWHFEAWGKEYGLKNEKEAEAWVKEDANRDRLPMGFVALDSGGMPIGMCTLSVEDGIIRPYSPWLSSLYVDPMHRKKGIGEKLVNKALDQAVKMGFEKVYLLTFKEFTYNWYKTLGWQEKEKPIFSGCLTYVMEKSLVLIHKNLEL